MRVSRGIVQRLITQYSCYFAAKTETRITHHLGKSHLVHHPFAPILVPRLGTKVVFTNMASSIGKEEAKPKSEGESLRVVEGAHVKSITSPDKTAIVASLKRKELDDPTVDNDSSKQARTCEDVLDLALTLGIKPQSRLEVQWDLVDDDSGKVDTHWWGANLLEHDGRTEDGVAIRVLDYDPHPEGGFPERSQEDVIFVGRDSLYNMGSESVLNYRREGDAEEEATVVFKGEDGVRDIVNGILTQVMQNHSQRWRGLTPAQQAKVADVVATQKEKLIEALMARPGEVITSSVMKDILEQTLGPNRIG